MQKLGLILPKLIISKINIDIIKRNIIDNWNNIIPNNIISFTKFNKLLFYKNFRLNVHLQILSCSIIIVKMYEKQIINNITKFTKIDNIHITYQQVININNDK